jgi:cardiolipin synthase
VGEEARRVSAAAKPTAGRGRALYDVEAIRALADQAFSRAAGAHLIEGNRVRLLRDARENYPAWLEAIRGARERVSLENYIIRSDATGERFAAALLERAQSGVRVRVVYDWLGCLGKSSSGFWARLRDGGIEVRGYNPPSAASPFGWLSRDHRKLLAVDGRVGFVTGLCIGDEWAGQPDRGIDPWRDTGIEIRGPAVGELEQSFASIWATLGAPIPDAELAAPRAAQEGTVGMRIIATLPVTAGVFRLDQLVAALARERVWMSDAYFAGPASYVQGLTEAARAGVDVRLLVPGTSDLPVVKLISRAGYRALLRAGVRVFEWNGSMMHAKTMVADGRWARVGSTNLNLASWLGNCELDAVIEDESFADEMEEMYLDDLSHATELVLDPRSKVRPLAGARTRLRRARRGRGSAGRAAAGAVRIGNAIGAAFTDRRVLEPVEGRLLLATGTALLASAALFGVFPRLAAYPLVVLLAWVGAALVYRGWTLRRAGKAEPRGDP